MHGTCCCTRWHRGHEVPSSFVGMGTCVRNNFGSARASLSASLVSFERRSSLCRVIRAGILTNFANMSKQKGVLSPPEGFFFKDSSKWISFCFFLSFGTEVWTGAAVPDVVGWGALLGVWSYCHKYCLSERVPTSCDVEGYAAKASFSPSESLRETTVTESSSAARETALHDLPLNLSLLVSHYSSLIISG